jgi:hypothetical protein
MPVSRWGWMGLCLLGSIGLMLGGWFLLGAHPTVPVRLDGRVADYERITAGPSYVRNDLRLNNDARTFSLDAGQFHPALPDQLYQNGKVTLWYNQGTTTIVAITLFDQNDAKPVTSTTPAYDRPDLTTQTNQQNSLLASGVSLLLLLGALVWALMQWRASRQRALDEPAPAYAGRGASSVRGGYR